MLLSWWYQSLGWHQHGQDVVHLLPKRWEKPIWNEGWGGEQPCTEHLVLGGSGQSCPVLWGDTGWVGITRSHGHTGTYWAHGHSTHCVMSLVKTRFSLWGLLRALLKSSEGCG